MRVNFSLVELICCSFALAPTTALLAWLHRNNHPLGFGILLFAAQIFAILILMAFYETKRKEFQGQWGMAFSLAVSGAMLGLVLAVPILAISVLANFFFH